MIVDLSHAAWALRKKAAGTLVIQTAIALRLPSIAAHHPKPKDILKHPQCFNEAFHGYGHEVVFPHDD